MQRLLEVRLDDDPPSLVMEYVEGPTLSSVIADGGPLPARDAVLFGLQLASALSFVHGQGFAHCDVKPSNVAVRDGRPVLLDLGIVRQLGATPGPGETRGSPPYMAPEQCRRRPVTPAMDAFALGGTLFELLSGEPPFAPKRTASGWSHPQLVRNAAPVTQASPGVPPSLAAVVDGMLVRDPGRRPSMPSVMTALHRVLADDLDEALWPSWVDGYLSP